MVIFFSAAVVVAGIANCLLEIGKWDKLSTGRRHTKREGVKEKDDANITTAATLFGFAAQASAFLQACFQSPFYVAVAIAALVSLPNFKASILLPSPLFL